MLIDKSKKPIFSSYQDTIHRSGTRRLLVQNKWNDTLWQRSESKKDGGEILSNTKYKIRKYPVRFVDEDEFVRVESVEKMDFYDEPK